MWEFLFCFRESVYLLKPPHFIILENQNIIAQIFKNVDLDTIAVNLINQGMERIEVKKGEILIDVNQVVIDQYYVHSGCLRSYFTDTVGKEHTLMFAINDWWISDYTAYFTKAAAIVTIECLQDAVIYKLPKEKLDNLYKNIPSLESFFRKKMEGAFASFQKRILGNISLSARERYHSFITTYPTIEKTVKNYHIASYLGITTESLSRIRKEIAKG